MFATCSKGALYYDILVFVPVPVFGIKGKYYMFLSIPRITFVQSFMNTDSVVKTNELTFALFLANARINYHLFRASGNTLSRQSLPS